MSRKMLVTAATLAVVIAGLGVFAPVSSQSPGQRTTMTFFDPKKTNYEKTIDVGKKNFSPGDYSVAVENLKDPETCEPAGKVLVRFMASKFIGKEDAFFHLDFAFRLPDGTINGTHAGRFSDFDSSAGGFAITGGTGPYKDVTGAFTFGADRVELCGVKGDLLTLDLAGVQ